MCNKHVKLQEKINTLESSNDNLKSENIELSNKVDLLNHELSILKNALYGKKSEKKAAVLSNHPNFLDQLFNEAEDTANEDMCEDEIEITVSDYQRKKGRKPLPKNLPRKQVIHDLEEGRKICHCGCMMVKIDEETSEQLDYIPAKIQILEHVRYKYACRECSENVQIAPAPVKPIDKGLPSAGLLSHIMVSKFEDAMPFYRQSKSWKRFDVELSDATLCNWALKSGQLLQPLINAMYVDLTKSDYVASDETPVNVLNSITSTSYMWVHISGERENRAVIFDYHNNRKKECVLDFLSDFNGYHQCDGYQGYDDLYHQGNIIRVGCMDHARRKFVDITKRVKKQGFAHKVVNVYMRKLYHVEKEAKQKKLPPDKIKELRLQKSKPVLDKLYQELLKYKDKTPPQMPLGKAITYMLNQWDALIAYLGDGRLRISNADVERSIKPFVIGRKNWLFQKSPRGAKASANLYSIIETCKANKINAFEYLRYVFIAIKQADGNPEEIRKLLPYNIDTSLLNS